jgi:hypothetical protein
VGGGTLGALYLSTGQAEWFASMVPLDPFVTMGLMTFGCAALGWLAGPSAGSAVFYLFRSRYKPQMRVVSAVPGMVKGNMDADGVIVQSERESVLCQNQEAQG